MYCILFASLFSVYSSFFKVLEVMKGFNSLCKTRGMHPRTLQHSHHTEAQTVARRLLGSPETLYQCVHKVQQAHRPTLSSASTGSEKKHVFSQSNWANEKHIPTKTHGVSHVYHIYYSIYGRYIFLCCTYIIYNRYLVPLGTCIGCIHI